jgi:hypothetical protein
MPLTDTTVRNAKPGAKPVKLYDERGLFPIVTPAGGKWWRFRYNFEGKEKLLSFGGVRHPPQTNCKNCFAGKLSRLLENLTSFVF